MLKIICDHENPDVACVPLKKQQQKHAYFYIAHNLLYLSIDFA